METAPEVKHRDSRTIKMNLRRVMMNATGIESPVHRIQGFPWSLFIADRSYGRQYTVWLKCEKSTESYLWHCKASLKFTMTYSSGEKSHYNVEHSFESW
ncbi:hypothetical protein PFISCL1PPCAC_12289 [Pristionchus fissidentatus]|uniref:MATH domain-containing protein n=2 Tax=Pristionchus fissidentatus TaxID=1538716 RepID=A0AAV5VQQ8_9BILA|nr:hypothetical protein PFISCL1PPCAC_12289 [Pristionchus fissidentatus]